MSFYKRAKRAVWWRIDRLMSRPKLNLFKTLYFNFRTMPFRVAVKLPVFFYGHAKFYVLEGCVEFDGTPIKRGMVKIGRNFDIFCAPRKCTMILLSENSRIVFHGPCVVSTGCGIRVRFGTTLSIGAYVGLMTEVKVLCEKGITIGNCTDVTFECQIVDTDFHYTYSETTQEARRDDGEIVIGAYNWIGNRTSIMKGARTPDYTMVGSMSLLNRDYSQQYDGKPLTLAGMPAKVVATGIRRVFSLDSESRIREFFRLNSNVNTMSWPVGDDISTDQPRWAGYANVKGLF
jgi:acetyltransferase-like isoleucine patch superfamily enzyme